jgi:putative spermidine/putrescine transport system permease protein
VAIPGYASGIERTWHYTFLVLCGAVFLFLVAPILAIVPLSFNSEPWFTYPLAGFSLRWYQDFFTSERWQVALFNSRWSCLWSSRRSRHISSTPSST